jgi:hypothetical protein
VPRYVSRDVFSVADRNVCLGLLKLVLVDHVHHMANTSPYLMERMARLAVHLCCKHMNQGIASHADGIAARSVQIVAAGGSGIAEFGGTASKVRQADVKVLPLHIAAANLSSTCASAAGVDYWPLMRMLRSMPIENIVAISDRLGMALLAFIRVSPGAAFVTNLEDWYLLFSLLTSTTAGVCGRNYVWAALHYLVQQNLISDKNFTPARQLLIKFLTK